MKCNEVKICDKFVRVNLTKLDIVTLVSSEKYGIEPTTATSDKGSLKCDIDNSDIFVPKLTRNLISSFDEVEDCEIIPVSLDDESEDKDDLINLYDDEFSMITESKNLSETTSTKLRNVSNAVVAENMSFPEEPISLSELKIEMELGNVIWSKYGRYPYWPCMISVDPFTNLFKKCVKGTQGKEHISYHVQFFGVDIQHAWIHSRHSFLYTGLSNYLQLTNSDPKNKYNIQAKYRKKWDFATEEAEGAFCVKHRTDRFDAYQFDYSKCKRYVQKKRKRRIRNKEFQNKMRNTIRDNEDFFSIQENNLKEEYNFKLLKTRSKDAKDTKESIKNFKDNSICMKNPEFQCDDNIEIDQTFDAISHENFQILSHNDVCEKYVVPYSDDKPHVCCTSCEAIINFKSSVVNVICSNCSFEQRNNLGCFGKYIKSIVKENAINNGRHYNENSARKKMDDNIENNIIQIPEYYKECENNRKDYTEGDKLAASSKDNFLRASPKLLCEMCSFHSPNIYCTACNKAYHITCLTSVAEPIFFFCKGCYSEQINSPINSPNDIINIIQSRLQENDKNIDLSNFENHVDYNRRNDLQHTFIPDDHNKEEENIHEFQELDVNNDNSDNENINIQNNHTDFDETNNSSLCSTDQDLPLDSLCENCCLPGCNVSCKTCGNSYHIRCLNMRVLLQSFSCSDCSSNEHVCFACKKRSTDVIICTYPKCSNYLHTNCALTINSIGKGIVCSQHVCVTCLRENEGSKIPFKGAFVKCIMCTYAFHAEENCIPAGSLEVNSTDIICPYHFFKTSIPSVYTSYCVNCQKGGNLVCCESCTSAFCIDCLNFTPTDGEFICEYCKKKHYLCYGMIVWAKSGRFRWWPAEIMHPSEIPNNIKNKSHYCGEFPVKYFGTNEYDWLHKGRTYLYTKNHFYKRDNVNSTEGSNLILPQQLDVKYRTALTEAAKAFEHYSNLRDSRYLNDDYEQIYDKLKIIKLKTNRYTSAKKKSFFDKKDSAPQKCACSDSMASPCDSNSNCLNRHTCLECCSSICSVNEFCQNRFFKLKAWALTYVFKTRDRGWGLKTKQTIKKGDFVIEYVGEIINLEEYNERISLMLPGSDFYFMKLDNDRLIDAGPMGNNARFINHSCNPNCIVQKWTTANDFKVGIFAARDIAKNEELSFDYAAVEVDNLTMCLCHSPNCRGFIGKTKQGKSKLIEID